MAAVALVGNMIAPGGGPASGCKLNSYIRNTTTRSPLYSDVGLTTPTTNPYVADADGRLSFYFDNAIEYEWSVTTSDGSTVIWEADIVGGLVTVTYSNGILIDGSWATPLATDLGARWAGHFASDLPACYVQDYKTGSNTWAAAAALAETAAIAAGHYTVIWPKAATLLTGLSPADGVYHVAAEGGTTITMSSASALTCFAFTGSSSNLTLAATITAGDLEAQFSSVTGIAAGDIISFYDNGTGKWQAQRVRNVITATNKIEFNNRFRFTIATGDASDEFIYWVEHDGGGLLGDWTFDGTAATGTTAIGYSITYGVGVKIGRVHGKFLRTNSPTAAQNGCLADVYLAYDCDFGLHTTYKCGSGQKGAVNIARTERCRMAGIDAEDSSSFGPVLQRCNAFQLGLWRSVGASARGSKLEYCHDFQIDRAEVDAAGATGLGILYGSYGSIDHATITRQRPLPLILSAIVASNVVTIVCDRPHLFIVGTSITIAGSAGAVLDGTHAVTAITGDPITSTTFTISVTTSNGTVTGSSVFTYANHSLWMNDTSGILDVGLLRVVGSNYSGSDIGIGATDRLYARRIVTDSTLSVSGTTTAGTNLFYDWLNGTRQVVNSGVGISFSANKNTTNQTSVTAATFVKVTFTTELRDTGALYDTTNSRWTPPAGQVRITATVGVSSGIATHEITQPAIYKNGSLFRYGAINSNSGIGVASGNVSCTDLANGTDYYEVYNYAGTAGTYTISGAIASTYFEGEQI